MLYWAVSFQHYNVYIYIWVSIVFYRPPMIRINDKVMIPQDDHPEINFVGLLIGPRGNTLKNLEKEVRFICV